MRDLECGIWNEGFRTGDMGLVIFDLRLRIWNEGLGIWDDLFGDLALGIWDDGFGMTDEGVGSLVMDLGYGSWDLG